MRAVVDGLDKVAENLLDILRLDHAPVHPKIVAVVDRGGAAIDPKGLTLDELLRTKRAKGSVAFCCAGHKQINAIDVIRALSLKSNHSVSLGARTHLTIPTRSL